MNGPSWSKRILVTGATGFIGSALIRALARRPYLVRAASRSAREHRDAHDVQWVPCDLLRPETLGPALADVDCAYYLVHSMGSNHADYRERDRRAARAFVAAAAQAHVGRIIYLGGVAPQGTPSEHLASRLEVGEILRSGPVPTIELRASMVIGAGSASWQIVRDLAMRLPAMVLPAWLRSRTSPVALEDVVDALVDAVELPLGESATYDLPGPDVLSGKDILMRIAALRGRSMPSVSVPVLSPRISALWLRLVTRADYSLARELVLGLEHDLLARDERYWELTNHPSRISFDEAARRALDAEPQPRTLKERLARIEENLAQRIDQGLGGR